MRVRRAGLIAFGIRMASVLTGLAFVIILTSNLAPVTYGLWNGISRVVNYSLFLTIVPVFWTTRYRARGTRLGRTIVVGGLVLSSGLFLIYIGLSAVISVHSVVQPNQWFYFLLSSFQIPLYTLIVVLEAILWGSKPENASLGFGFFEMAKVALVFALVKFYPDRLADAIGAIVLAEVAQLGAVIYLTRYEYSDKLSLGILKSMVKTSWLAILNNVHPFVISVDYLVILFLSSAFLPSAQFATVFAFFSAALVIASTQSYTGWISSGLYASVLSGKDPRRSTNQVLELQLTFLLPMTVGAIILSQRLLSLLRPEYAGAYPILIVLTVGSAFLAVATTPDYVIAGSDRTDAGRETDFGLYLSSKLFLISKINLGFAFGYLFVLAFASIVLRLVPGLLSGAAVILTIGLIWAAAYLAMGLGVFSAKMYFANKIAPISLSRNLLVSLGLATAVFGIVLEFMARIVSEPTSGKILQATSLFMMGVPALAVYAGLLILLSRSVRETVKAIILTVLNRT